MKTNYIKINRLIPWLGSVLIAGGVVTAATYLDLERTTHSAQASTATLNRLCRDLQLGSVLKRIHAGEVDEAAKVLDLLLCGDILLSNAELASSDAETQALVQDTFRSIARVRPKTEEARTGPTQEHINDQLAAEQILARACAAARNTAMK
jgi:hypothetical protein